MKKLLLTLIFFQIIYLAGAQSFKWAKLEGAGAYDYSYGIVTDHKGNVYVAGKYEGNAVFSGTTLTCRGNHDVFLAKYDSLGALKWIKTAGGPLGDYAHNLASDGQYLYVCGEIETSSTTTEDIEFDGYATKFKGRGSNDAFIAKYDMDGNVLWVHQMAGGSDDKAYAVSFDKAGNVYTSGFFSGDCFFGPNNVKVSTTSLTDRDVFLAKFNAAGDFQWVKTGGSPDREQIYGMVTDSTGNSYLTGAFHNNAVFDGVTLHTYNNSSYWDGCLLKYDKDGTLSWAKSFGGDYDEVGWAPVITKDGKIYVAGEYNAYCVFGTPATALTANGLTDAFVACYDPSGTCTMVKGFGGSLIDRCRGIGTDGVNVFVTGQYGSTMSVGTHSLTAVDSSDVFAARMNPDGTFAWALTVGGGVDAYENLGYESGECITTDHLGNAYMGAALLDGGICGSTTLYKYGRTDAVIAKIDHAATPYTVSDPGGNGGGGGGNGVGIALNNMAKGMSIYPMPCKDYIHLQVQSELAESAQLTLVDLLGHTIKTVKINSSANIPVSDVSNGVYILQMKYKDSVTNTRIVVNN